MDSEYKPVACQLYDELGLRMLRNTVCELVLDGEEGSETVRTVIRDLFTDGDAEYVLLESGRRIRLDRIQRVEDVESSAG